MTTAASTNPSKLWHSARPAPKAHLLLLALSLAQFVPIIPVNVQIVLQAAICVYCGSWRSIKPSPPQETMSKTDAMKFPVMGSALLVTLFLAFKFLPKWVVNVLIAVRTQVASCHASVC
jgi:minor histocompatibility antigen H13